ncbi:WD repeat-containing protein 63 [Phytophthora cinnamomi]|uniref:WD repeat-containing protein 63 n=1 Tax=Phytophthora cinnamomi TaxID=4785 RepID=UPI00355A8091|nr:WD repeat-containing protein 63 [Phytophthora cinnamomi]
MAGSPTSDDGEDVGRAASESDDVLESEDSQLEDAPKAFPDSGEESDADDDEETELEHAARAGIRLLEENAQLQEELRQLQEQCTQVESEKEELLRLVAEKDEQEAQLSEHLRESIRENQSILSELSKAKAQIDELNGINLPDYSDGGASVV